jgi:hypothetical protein
MKHEQAMKLSQRGIAVRGSGGKMVNYVFDTGDRARFKVGEREHDEDFIRRTYGAKGLPLPYCAIYDDWEPWKPKDAVTALGDILRIVDTTLLVARLAG